MNIFNVPRKRHTEGCVSTMRLQFLHKFVSIKAIKIQLQQINRKKAAQPMALHMRLFSSSLKFRSIATMANGASVEYNTTVAANDRPKTFKFPKSICTFDSIAIAIFDHSYFEWQLCNFILNKMHSVVWHYDGGKAMKSMNCTQMIERTLKIYTTSKTDDDRILFTVTEKGICTARTHHYSTLNAMSSTLFSIHLTRRERERESERNGRRHARP